MDQNSTFSKANRWSIFLAIWAISAILFLTDSLTDDWFFFGAGVIFLVALVKFLRTDQAQIRIYQFRQLSEEFLSHFAHYQIPLTVSVTFIAAYWMYRSAQYLKPNANTPELTVAFQYLVLGFAAMGLATLFSHHKITLQSRSFTHISPPRTNWVFVGFGTFLLWALAEANGHLLEINRLVNVTNFSQLWLLCGGTLFVVWGLGGGAIPRRFPHIYKSETLAVIGITIFAFICRVWHLETAFHKFIDELNFAGYALFFKNDDSIHLLSPEVRGFPAIYSFFQFLGTEIWGRNLFAIRMVSVIFGTLTIPALYFLAKQLFDHKTALIAAALLAVFPPHVHHSRLALNNIADPLFGTLAFAFIARGLRYNRRLDFAIGGAALGLTQYFYEGGRLLFPPLMVGWLIFGFIFWRPRPQLRGLLMSAFAAFIIAAPIYYTLYARDGSSAPRFDQEASDLDFSKVFSDEEIQDQYLENLRFSFLVYVNQPEWLHIYYGGDYGLILPFLLPVFFLGVGFTLWRFYTPAILLIFWLLLTSFGTSILFRPVLTPRYVVLFPILPLFIAIGFRYTAQLIWHPRLSLRYQSLALAVLVSVFAFAQIFFYATIHLDRYNQQIRQNARYDGEDAILRSSDFDFGTQVYIFSEETIDQNYGRGVLNFLTDGVLFYVISPRTLNEQRIANMPQTMDNAFFLDPYDQQTLRWLQKYFILEEPQYSHYNVPSEKQLVLYYAHAREN